MTLLTILLTAFLSWTTPIASAQEYLGPEEVLLQQEESIYQVPDSDRAVRQRAAERERLRQERLLNSSSSASGDTELPTLHPAAGGEFDASGEGEVVIGTSDDVADQLGAPGSDAIGGEMSDPIYIPPYTDDTSNTLPGSGPALILALIAIAGAGCWTVLRAVRLRAFTK